MLLPTKSESLRNTLLLNIKWHHFLLRNKKKTYASCFQFWLVHCNRGAVKSDKWNCNSWYLEKQCNNCQCSCCLKYFVNSQQNHNFLIISEQFLKGIHTCNAAGKPMKNLSYASQFQFPVLNFTLAVFGPDPTHFWPLLPCFPSSISQILSVYYLINVHLVHRPDDRRIVSITSPSISLDRQ